MSNNLYSTKLQFDKHYLQLFQEEGMQNSQK